MTSVGPKEGGGGGSYQLIVVPDAVGVIADDHLVEEVKVSSIPLSDAHHRSALVVTKLDGVWGASLVGVNELWPDHLE